MEYRLKPSRSPLSSLLVNFCAQNRNIFQNTCPKKEKVNAEGDNFYLYSYILALQVIPLINLLYLLKEMQAGMKTIDELKQEIANTTLPQKTKEVFYRVLDTADVGSLSEKDQMRYESALKNYLDTMSCIEYATVKVREEGKTEAKVSIAKSMKAEGMNAAVISRCTGLSLEQIEAL